jgi:hypothetical protein
MIAFMSYQTEDRAMAAAVATLLQSLGIGCFMAHEHIEVSVQWRDEILRQIGLADLFVPILSKQYNASIWCIQESGIAAFRAMTIIPLSMDGSIPPGAISHIQSSRIENDRPTLQQVLPGIAARDISFAIDGITRVIEASGNFRAAEANFQLIRPYLVKATDAQIVGLLTASNNNDQICHASLCAREYLPPLMQSHGHLLPPPIRQNLQGVLAKYAY